MCYDAPKDWAKRLLLAEYWYNTTYHRTAKMTLFQVMYGQPPPVQRPYLARTYLVEAIDRSLQQKDKTLQQLKDNLVRAQNIMTQLPNKKRSDKTFEEGCWVCLKLKPYK